MDENEQYSRGVCYHDEERNENKTFVGRREEPGAKKGSQEKTETFLIGQKAKTTV